MSFQFLAFGRWGLVPDPDSRLRGVLSLATEGAPVMRLMTGSGSRNRDGMSPNRKSAFLAGYTLLELCISMAIIAVLAGMAIPKIRDMVREDRMWSVAREILSDGADCRRLAIQTGRSYAVVIDHSELQTTVWPAPRSAALLPPRVGEPPVCIETWNPERRLWELAAVEWVFRPSGLCTPLKVRLVAPGGWIEQQFSPLTATVDDEAWNFD